MESRDALRGGVHLPQALAPARMIFRETAIEGVWVVEPERLRGRARLLRPHLGLRRVRRARPERRDSSSAASRTTVAAARSAACTTRRPRTRRQSSCAARRARSSTSRSTCGQVRRHFRSWVGVELTAENRLALYVPEGCAHGFLTLDGRLRGRLPDLGAPRPRGRARRPLRRSGVRDRLAGRGRGHQRARPLVPGLRVRPRRPRDVASLSSATGAGERMHALATRALPALPEHHRRRRPGDAARDRASASRSRCTRCRAAPQVLDWTVPDEWNIRERTSRRPAGDASSTSASRTSTSSATASPCGRRCRSTSSGRTCTRTPTSPTGSRTARRTTRGPGASASREARARRARGGTVRGRGRQHARAGLADVRRVLLAGRAGRRGARSPPTSAIPRSRTTTSPASRS